MINEAQYPLLIYSPPASQLPGLLLLDSCYRPMLTRHQEQGERITSIVLIIVIIAHRRLPLRVIKLLVTAKVTLVRRRFSIDDRLGVPV